MSMLSKIIKFLEKFPNDTTSWVEATDEIRDLAREAKEMYNWYTLKLNEEDWGSKGLKALDFKSFSKPSDWNTKGKAYIIETFNKMDNKTKRDFYERFNNWFEN